MRKRWTSGVITLATMVVSLQAQDTSIRLAKPDNVFFYPQLNVHGGYDSAEPGDGWGWADRGARTLVALEVAAKDEEHLQRGYTRFIEPVSWNIKLGVELDPEEDDAQEIEPRLRAFDTWVKLGTKWDRTALWVGHKSLPYGHNPRLDPGHSFLPNQAGLDLSFGRDTGVFAKTPVSGEWDVELAVTGGKGDSWDYHGGWLATGRVGSPTYEPDELGIFAVGGKIQRTSGARTTNRSLTDIWRLGGDWVHKHGEVWKAVNQVSLGGNSDGATQDRLVANLLNSVEWFADDRWTFGVTHALRYEKLQTTPSDSRTLGRVFASLSFATTRDSRLRLNVYSEYEDSEGTHDSAVFLQFCVGCGLIK